MPALRFTDSYSGPVRAVRVRERWTERHRVGRDAHRRRFQSGGHAQRHGRAARHNQRQRAGPEGARQFMRNGRRSAHHARQVVRRGQVHYERVFRRAAFGFEDARHGCGIQGIGAQAIDRLGGKGDQAAALDFGGSLGDDFSFGELRVDAQEAGDHEAGHSLAMLRLAVPSGDQHSVTIRHYFTGTTNAGDSR